MHGLEHNVCSEYHKGWDTTQQSPVTSELQVPDRPVEGVKVDLSQRLPASYFFVCDGLMCYHTEQRCQPCDLLVILRTKALLLMHQAHSHCSHLWGCNTLEKLQDRFLWPGMNMEICWSWTKKLGRSSVRLWLSRSTRWLPIQSNRGCTIL